LAKIAESREKPKCPRCGSPDVLPIVYGFPGQEMMEAANSGKIRLGGCCISADMPMQQCSLCGSKWNSGG